jgi:FMN phosphatase YigB (HAD superfamily)
MTTVHTTEIDDLCQLFLEQSPSLDILSLDCFDTLLWRRVEKPTEVFQSLQQRPTFQRMGLNATLRISIETEARKYRRIADGSNEVSLADIYRAGLPDVSELDLQALMHEELDEEKQACFAYAPIIRLIQGARDAGMKVIIVSDTYFSETQLRELLAHCLPEETMAAISRVFCSNAFGISKAGGMFQPVLENVGCSPERIVHIGDHPQADLEAALAAGMKAFQLDRWQDSARQILQMNGNAARQIQPELGIRRPVPSPFHAVFAHNPLSEQHSAAVLGFNGLGPIIWSFARWLREEGRELTKEGPCKYLFLLRDGYLPKLAFDLVNDNANISSYAVEISRFTSYAASFRSEADVLEYLVRLEGPDLEPMCKQLLLPEKLKRSIMGQVERSSQPQQTFRKLIRKKSTLKKIFQASQAFRERLLTYLMRTVDLREGDRLILVDLGYSGTAQNRLQPVMEQEWKVSVFGLYLLLYNKPGWQQTRKGMIDPKLVDDAAISTLVPYVAALEMVCTNNAGSVVNYTEKGTSVRKEPDLPEEQYDMVGKVQQHVLRFVKQAQTCVAEMDMVGEIDSLREAALAALARLSFYPIREEIEAMKSFYLDVNLGTDLKIQLFDTDIALEGLQQSGLFYAMTEQRMNLPMELCFHGLELSYTFFMQHRFAQNLRLEDFAVRRETVPVMLVRGSEASRTDVSAYPTYDGFYSMIIPIGQMEYELGIQFGECYRWLQLKSVTAVSAAELFQKKSVGELRHDSEIDLLHLLVYDQIQQHEGGLLACESKAGFVYVPMPESAQTKGNMACLVIFRPLTSWSVHE